MRKLLMITTALCIGMAPAQAKADPITAAITGALKWATAALTPLFGATIAQALVQFGVSAILGRVAMAIRGKPKQQELMRELAQPDSLPVWRFVYGKCMAPGTPAPVRVKGAILYACFLLNSRASAGPFTVYFDKREVEASGDPYDFATGGATATNSPFAGFAKYWIGRGDQTSPPAQILSEAPEFFDATDGWQGRTVLWVRLDAGPNQTRGDRWPATPPEVLVDGYWSKVWDPRDAMQDQDDPETWEWSANHGLCALDALRTNPLRPYLDRYLWAETFEWAADVADEPVAVQGGGTIPRYEVNGVLAFQRGSELEDQVIPIAQAGAARFIRVGGKLGMIPGTYSAPVMTLDDVMDTAPLAFSRYRPSSELVNSVSATYANPERFYEDAETPIYTLPGTIAEDNGNDQLGQYDLSFVTDHRQAQRVAKILGMRTRMQRTINGVFPPKAFDLVSGSTVTLSLPPPYTGRNGIYEVEEAHPGLDVLGLQGSAVQVALSLRETSSAVYAWSVDEEQAIPVEDFDASVGLPDPPSDLQASAELSGITPQIAFDFLPSPSASVSSYEWQYLPPDSGAWLTGGLIDPLSVSGGRLYGNLQVASGGLYSIRVRALGLTGASPWVTLAGISVDAEVIIDGGEV